MIYPVNFVMSIVTALNRKFAGTGFDFNIVFSFQLEDDQYVIYAAAFGGKKPLYFVSTVDSSVREVNRIAGSIFIPSSNVSYYSHEFHRLIKETDYALVISGGFDISLS